MNSLRTILIVDDEKDLLEMYKELLELDNFIVYTASSAGSALEILSKNINIQVIISDSHMNKMTGMELLQVISKKQVRPLFYLATGDLEQTDEEIKNLGGTGLIFKPFDMDVIIQRILKDLDGKI